MEAWRIIGILIVAFIAIPVAGGVCCLKIYDEFRKAVEKNSRARLLFAFSMAFFTVFIAIVLFTSLGITLNKQQLPSVSILLPSKAGSPKHVMLKRNHRVAQRQKEVTQSKRRRGVVNKHFIPLRVTPLLPLCNSVIYFFSDYFRALHV